MSKTLKISDELFTELEESAKERGLGSVEHLLQEWQQEQCPFVTADEKLVNALGTAFGNVTLLANW